MGLFQVMQYVGTNVIIIGIFCCCNGEICTEANPSRDRARRSQTKAVLPTLFRLVLLLFIPNALHFIPIKPLFGK